MLYNISFITYRHDTAYSYTIAAYLEFSSYITFWKYIALPKMPRQMHIIQDVAQDKCTADSLATFMFQIIGHLVTPAVTVMWPPLSGLPSRAGCRPPPAGHGPVSPGAPQAAGMPVPGRTWPLPDRRVHRTFAFSSLSTFTSLASWTTWSPA